VTLMAKTLAQFLVGAANVLAKSMATGGFVLREISRNATSERLVSKRFRTSGRAREVSRLLRRLARTSTDEKPSKKQGRDQLRNQVACHTGSRVHFLTRGPKNFRTAGGIMGMTKLHAGRWPGGGGSDGTVPDESHLAKLCLCPDRGASSLLPHSWIGNYPRRTGAYQRRSPTRGGLDISGGIYKRCNLFLGAPHPSAARLMQVH
jgi:hypothetical protein